MQDRLADIINKLRSNCDYLDIRLEESTYLQLAINNGQASQLISESSIGGAVRVCTKGGWGFVSFNDVSSLEDCAKRAAEQAKAIGRGKTALAPVEPIVAEFTSELIDSPANHSLDEKMELLFHYDDVVRSESANPSSVVKYGETFSSKTFASSEGSFIRQELVDLFLGANALIKHKDIVQKGKVEAGSSNDFGEVLGLEDRIAQQCKLASEVVRSDEVKAGKYTVIIDPVLAGLFVHEAFGHLCEADNYLEDPTLASVLAMGKTIAAPLLNIYDSGVDLGTRGRVPFDDEGVPSEKTYLVREGKLVGRLHSRETAALMNEKPTGNGRAASYRYKPLCRMRNTCIEGGKTSFADMLSEVKNGLYLLGCQGGFSCEDFSFNSLYGYVIERGKLKGMLRPAALTGNIWHTLKNISAVGDDFVIIDSPGGCCKGDQPHLAVSFGSPHIKIENILVS